MDWGYYQGLESIVLSEYGAHHSVVMRQISIDRSSTVESHLPIRPLFDVQLTVSE